MVINVSVQYNGGLLPNIILLTEYDYIGELLSAKNHTKSRLPKRVSCGAVLMASTMLQYVWSSHISEYGSTG